MGKRCWNSNSPPAGNPSKNEWCEFHKEFNITPLSLYQHAERWFRCVYSSIPSVCILTLHLLMCALLLQVCVRGLSPCSLTWFFFIGKDVDGWSQKAKHIHNRSKTLFPICFHCGLLNWGLCSSNRFVGAYYNWQQKFRSWKQDV